MSLIRREGGYLVGARAAFFVPNYFNRLFQNQAKHKTRLILSAS